MMQKNEFNQALGRPIDHWQPCKIPPRITLKGDYSTVEPFKPDNHFDALFDVLASGQNEKSWTYLPYGPFATKSDYRAWLNNLSVVEPDTQLYVIFNTENKLVGIAAYLRINPTHGSIEIGHLNFSSALQKTPTATEAMYLMMRHAFDDLGYRRYEWKCNTLNEPSRQAALRYGFTFEGIFRQSNVFKNRNRDTAWFSILDNEWPAIKTRFENWLKPTNFDAAGNQITKLSDC